MALEAPSTSTPKTTQEKSQFSQIFGNLELHDRYNAIVIKARVFLVCVVVLRTLGSFMVRTSSGLTPICGVAGMGKMGRACFKRFSLTNFEGPHVFAAQISYLRTYMPTLV